MALTITHPSLKQITVDVLRAAFAEFDIAPTSNLLIIPASPDGWANLPCIMVQQMGDGETASHIGDSIADQFIDGDIEVTLGNSYLATQIVEVRLFSKFKDERDRIGHLLPAAFLRGRGTSVNPGLFITTPGLDLPKVSGGADEEIADTSKEFSPHSIYMRSFNLSALAEVTIQENAGPPLDDVLVRGEFYDADTEVDLTFSEP